MEMLDKARNQTRAAKLSDILEIVLKKYLVAAQQVFIVQLSKLRC